MNINGIETQYQNYAGGGTSRTKSSNSESKSNSFQNEIVNWEKRIKESIDKEQENDSNSSIMMSEKKWCNLMKKVDNVIDTIKDNKNLIPKDTIADSFQTHKKTEKD
jgi:hypothetical protein